jgi:hypothetical protein
MYGGAKDATRAPHPQARERAGAVRPGLGDDQGSAALHCREFTPYCIHFILGIRWIYMKWKRDCESGMKWIYMTWIREGD